MSCFMMDIGLVSDYAGEDLTSIPTNQNSLPHMIFKILYRRALSSAFIIELREGGQMQYL